MGLIHYYKITGHPMRSGPTYLGQSPPQVWCWLLGPGLTLAAALVQAAAAKEWALASASGWNLLGMKLIHNGLYSGAETPANVEVSQHCAAYAYKCWCWDRDPRAWTLPWDLSASAPAWAIEQGPTRWRQQRELRLKQNHSMVDTS